MLHLFAVLACLAFVASGRRSIGQDFRLLDAKQSARSLEALGMMLYAMPPGVRTHRTSLVKEILAANSRAPVLAMGDLADLTDEEIMELTPTDVIASGQDLEDEDMDANYEQRAERARSEEAVSAQRALAESAVNALKQNADVVAALETKKGKPTGKIAKTLKKVSEFSITCIGEALSFGDRDAIAYGGFDLADPDFLSSQFRDGGCKAVMVPVDYEFALGPDALKRTVAEQESSGIFPPPLPVIVRSPLIDPLQIAQAALGGAAGVVVPMSVAGEEQTRELMAVAEELGLEALVRVTSAEQLATALEFGAKIIVFGDMTVGEATQLRESLPEDVVTVADVPYEEVRGVWKVRDAGFDAFVSGLTLKRMVVRDRVTPSGIIKSMLMKGSVKYGSGIKHGQFEGSKERLGDIMM